MEAFRQRFPNLDAAGGGGAAGGGKTDFFPAQALETWQCWNVSDRTDCTTNPTPDIAGLFAVLNRLLALPVRIILCIYMSVY